MTTITWVHISDLHFQVGDENNRKAVLDSLMADINTCIDKDGLQPDFVVFTGDVAYHGWEEEYNLAVEHFFRPLLKITNRSPNELFIVPGNHDVDWDLVAMLSPDIPAQLDNRDSVNSFISCNKKRQTVLQPQEAYYHFLHGFSATHLEPETLAFSFVRTLTKDSTTIAFIGLNSTWLSGFARKDGQSDDYGHLLIGEVQVAEALDKAAGADIKIALVHHPFDSLKEFDRDDVESRLRKACHFILRGHRHRAGFIQELTLEGETIIIPAGAAYDRREYPNGYNFVQLDLESGKGIMYLRRYSDRQFGWIKDIDATGETRNGIWEFTLPKGLGATIGQNVLSPALRNVDVSPGDLKLIRDYEKELQRLADLLSPIDLWSRNARSKGQPTTDSEYLDVCKSWGDSQAQYQRVLVLSSHIYLFQHSEKWERLFYEIKDAWDCLDEVLNRDMRRDIPGRIQKLSKKLVTLQIEVSIEVDRLLSSR